MKRPDLFAPLPVGFFRHPTTKEARAHEHGAPEAFLVLVADAEAQHRRGAPFGVVRLTWDDYLVCLGHAPDTQPYARRLLDVMEAVGWVTEVSAGTFGFRATLPNMGHWSDRRASKTAADADGVEAAATSKAAPEHRRLSHLLADLILKRDPKARVQPDSARWLDACRLLIDRDGRTVAEVEHVIRWCQADGFWQANILSFPKLREKFDALSAKAGKPASMDDFDRRMGASA